jgi:trk system potassium uptake protein TrkA
MRQFAVIGLGRFGLSVAKTLSEKGFQVLAIDNDENKVRIASEFVTRAVQLDAIDGESLKGVGLQDVDVAVIAIGEDISASILITMLTKELEVPMVVSKALDPIQGRVLAKVGADRVVFPERDMGKRIAESLVSPGIFDYISLSKGHSIVEISAPSCFYNRTIGKINLRARYGVTLIAIKRKVPEIGEEGEAAFKEEILIAPTSGDEILQGDILVALGSVKDIERMKKL